MGLEDRNIMFRKIGPLRETLRNIEHMLSGNPGKAILVTHFDPRGGVGRAPTGKRLMVMLISATQRASCS